MSGGWRDQTSQQWRQEIDAALASAQVAVLLVSPNFLASNFIVNEELSYLFDAAQQRRVRLLWFSSLRACTSRLRSSTFRRSMTSHGRSIRCAGRARQRLEGDCPGHCGGRRRDDPSESLRLPRHRRLPTSGPLFVGREAELARLDAAWEAPGTHVLTFVAFGGVGKSTLVARWLDRMAADDWRGARRVLDCPSTAGHRGARHLGGPLSRHALGFFEIRIPSRARRGTAGCGWPSWSGGRRLCLCSTASSPFSIRRVPWAAGSKTLVWRPS